MLPCPARPTGIGLLQMLLSVAVLACLLAIALPSFQQLWRSMQADRLRLQLHTSFARARSTAITLRQTIAVCASHDGLHCGDDWSGGWMLYRARPNGLGNDGGAPGEILLHQPHPRIKGLQAAVPGSRPRLLFHADGRSGNSNQTVVICLQGQRHGQLVINIGGRIRSMRVRETRAC